MKEIHKSEILEKLALGWKVRCKVWKAGDYADKGWPISTLLAYLTDNNSWEAEPPCPVPYHQFLNVAQAFERLKNHNGIKYITRTAWPHKVIKYCEIASYMLTAEDILAEDWETYK
jgi:hypothetical protein